MQTSLSFSKEDLLNLSVIRCTFEILYCVVQERKIFDEKFIRLDTRRLCELTSAADSLEMKTLVELSSRALARMIEGKTPEEIRETFHLPDDLTEVCCKQEVGASNPYSMPMFFHTELVFARKRNWSPLET